MESQNNNNQDPKWEECWNQEIRQQKYLKEHLIGFIKQNAQYNASKIDREYEHDSYLSKYQQILSGIHQQINLQDTLKAEIDYIEDELKYSRVDGIEDSFNIVNKIMQKQSKKLAKKISKRVTKEQKKQYQEDLANIEQIKSDHYRLKKASDELKTLKLQYNEIAAVLEQKKMRFDILKKKFDENMKLKEAMLKEKQDLLDELEEMKKSGSSSLDSSDEELF